MEVLEGYVCSAVSIIWEQRLFLKGPDSMGRFETSEPSFVQLVVELVFHNELSL